MWGTLVLYRLLTCGLCGCCEVHCFTALDAWRKNILRTFYTLLACKNMRQQTIRPLVLFTLLPSAVWWETNYHKHGEHLWTSFDMSHNSSFLYYLTFLFESIRGLWININLKEEEKNVFYQIRLFSLKFVAIYEKECTVFLLLLFCQDLQVLIIPLGINSFMQDSSAYCFLLLVCWSMWMSF